MAHTRAAGRREESYGTTAFTGGEGASVVVVECDEVLQLGRGKGVRKLQEIVRIGGSRRSSSGMADGGGARPKYEWRRSAGIRVREGLPVVRERGAVGKGVALKRGAGEEWVTEERTGVQARFERPVGGVAEREKGRERGVSWGLALTGRRLSAAARARRARCWLEIERGGD
jgi:hypothetical protein